VSTEKNGSKDQDWTFRETLRRVFPYLKPYRKKLLIGFFCIAGTNLFGVLSPLVLKYGIQDLQAGVTVEKIFQYSAYIVVIAVVAGIFRYLMRRIIISVSRWVEFDLRNQYYGHLQTLSASFFDKQQTGDLMTRATSDIEAVRMIVGPAIMYSLDTIITFTFSVSLMIVLSVPLTLAVLAMSPFISLLIYIIAKKIHVYSLLTQNRYSTLNAMTQEHLSGIRVVRSYCQEAPEAELYNSLNTSYLDANMKLVKMQAALFPMFYSIFGIGMALILYIGGRSIMAGSMSLGDFVAFSAYVGMLAWPVIAVGWVMNLFQRGSASMSRIVKILDTKPEITDPSGDSIVEKLTGEITFDDVSFQYPGTTKPVIENFSLQIPAGSSVGIVGQVGSGKSTLASLITRQYDISGGSLTIDGHKISEIPLETLRRTVSTVPQDSFLFSDQIWSNVLYAQNNYDEELLKKVADASNLSEDVESFPESFDTWVGERGITLSGGQKQRTSIARALAADGQIVIFDDCFSAVDTQTEAEILTKIKPLIQGKTVIIIAHRISTLHWVDNIIFLHKGRIVESGSHDDLLAQKGRYADLYKKQLLEEELQSGE